MEGTPSVFHFEGATRPEIYRERFRSNAQGTECSTERVRKARTDIEDNFAIAPRVEYELTALGQTVLPLITALGKWGDDHQDHLRRVITQSARF
jgi:hypothetical protein